MNSLFVPAPTIIQLNGDLDES